MNFKFSDMGFCIIDNMPDFRRAIKECEQVLASVRVLEDDYVTVRVSKAAVTEAVKGWTSKNIKLTQVMLLENGNLLIG